MKISLSEIWNFSELIHTDEKEWSYKLVAGECHLEVSQRVLLELKKDPAYDTELLPSIFTFREVLWQPDVYTEAVSSLPGLRILHAYCMELVEEYADRNELTAPVYGALLQELARCCQQAVEALENEHANGKKILGDLRIRAFPMVKFFIFHPQNRLDYYRDAVNRLNYAVKIILTQFHGRYTELTDPYWDVSCKKASLPTHDKVGPRESSEEK